MPESQVHEALPLAAERSAAGTSSAGATSAGAGAASFGASAAGGLLSRRSPRSRRSPPRRLLSRSPPRRLDELLNELSNELSSKLLDELWQELLNGNIARVSGARGPPARCGIRCLGGGPLAAVLPRPLPQGLLARRRPTPLAATSSRKSHREGSWASSWLRSPTILEQARERALGRAFGS